MTHVLIAGLSTRAVADSAVRAGFAVTTIDAFADLDLHPAVRGVSLPRDFGLGFSAQAAACAASDLPGEVAAYASNFENDPDAVRTLAAGRILQSGAPRAVYLRPASPAVARALGARVEAGGGEYSFDHSASVYLMDRASRFYSVIGYDEPDEPALARLRKLVRR